MISLLTENESFKFYCFLFSLLYSLMKEEKKKNARVTSNIFKDSFSIKKKKISYLIEQCFLASRIYLQKYHCFLFLFGVCVCFLFFGSTNDLQMYKYKLAYYKTKRFMSNNINSIFHYASSSLVSGASFSHQILNYPPLVALPSFIFWSSSSRLWGKKTIILVFDIFFPESYEINYCIYWALFLVLSLVQTQRINK